MARATVKTIRNTLLFIVTIFLGITGFLFQEIIYQAIG